MSNLTANPALEHEYTTVVLKIGDRELTSKLKEMEKELKVGRCRAAEADAVISWSFFLGGLVVLVVSRSVESSRGAVLLVLVLT